jgi:hypothetical protein
MRQKPRSETKRKIFLLSDFVPATEKIIEIAHNGVGILTKLRERKCSLVNMVVIVALHEEHAFMSPN